MNGDEEQPKPDNFPLYEEDDDFEVREEDVDQSSPLHRSNDQLRDEVGIIDDMVTPISDEAAAIKADALGVPYPSRFEHIGKDEPDNVIDAADRFGSDLPPADDDK